MGLETTQDVGIATTGNGLPPDLGSGTIPPLAPPTKRGGPPKGPARLFVEEYATFPATGTDLEAVAALYKQAQEIKVEGVTEANIQSAYNAFKKAKGLVVPRGPVGGKVKKPKVMQVPEVDLSRAVAVMADLQARQQLVMQAATQLVSDEAACQKLLADLTARFAARSQANATFQAALLELSGLTQDILGSVAYYVRRNDALEKAAELHEGKTKQLEDEVIRMRDFEAKYKRMIQILNCPGWEDVRDRIMPML